jgi:hypothetical protein
LLDFLTKVCLFNFFVDGMLIAVGTVFLDFQSAGGITTVFAGGVAGNAGATLIGITAAFRAFYGDD